MGLRALAVLALAWLTASGGSRRAGSADPEATLVCDEGASIGRVRCEARARVHEGKIAWGDVVLLRAPPFVRVLRGRLGPSEASERVDDAWRWPFGVVAQDRGEGEIEARVRLVVCMPRGTCAPREITAKTTLAVR